MKSLSIITLLSVSTMIFGQKNFNDYAQFYPISDNANIRWMTFPIPSTKQYFLRLTLL